MPTLLSVAILALFTEQIHCLGKPRVTAETNVFATDAYAPPAHLTKYAILGIALGWSMYGLIFMISLVTLTYC